MKFVGGKAQAGFYQKIINLIPWHRVYLEPFLGSGAIMRFKAPAEISIGVDLAAPRATMPAGARFILGDGIEFLKGYKWRGDEFVYADPPYLLSTRGGRRYYKFEMTDADHIRLINVLRGIRARVMVSGYPSSMYNARLADWHCEKFQMFNRANKPATECLWMNYRPPALPVDVRYYGKNFRDRLRLKRKVSRWFKRLEALPEGERELLIAALVKLRATPGSAIYGAGGLAALR
jgi:DNA adenine methylase